MSKSPFRVPVALVVAALLAGCGGGGGSSPAPAPILVPKIVPPASAPSPVSTAVANAAAYTCPSSATASAALAGGSQTLETVRRAPLRGAGQTPSASNRIAVTYDRSMLFSSRARLQEREGNLGAASVQELDFPHTGKTTRILAVPQGQMQSVAATLRAQPGVRSVAAAGARRYASSVSTPFFTNDQYFNGFGAFFHVPPYSESASSAGQWDEHATRLEYAFAYSQPSNGSGIVNTAALGSSNVKIAVIDSGEDATHPELRSKIVYQRCFITNPSGVRSSSTFSTDPDGHGTDVSGIAAAATNDALGFAGNGGNASIYGYRVFPTPDDKCADPKTDAGDAQCGTDTADIAAAVADAVANHVNVINLSVGGGGCVNGVDDDVAERNAIAEAIAANVIVVASAGNGGTGSLAAPACDTGVIAAGASALGDGSVNGSGLPKGTAATPIEYVASYSQHGSPGAALNNPAAWGIVAPGGDPTATDADKLHWIENIWTSTPFDTKFSGLCTSDFGTTSVADCRVEIAGTSMSSPAVAGAAALILAVNPGYQSPALMKQLLCSTAHDIGDPNQGCGRLDTYRAMAVALGDPSPPAP